MNGEIQHPAFPQPIDLKVKLWRYLDIEKFEWLLENKRLFMPTAEDLGDPLEGSQPIGEANWWRDQAANAEDNDKKQIIETNAKKILGFSKLFRKNYFVSCWHMNSSDNDKMWRCYTESAESVAISTTYNNLINLRSAHVNIGVVRYIDYSTEKLPTTFNLFEYITHKNINFSFENEVRIVAALLMDEQLESDEFKGNIFELEKSPDFKFFAPPINLTSLVQKVVIHPNATSEFEEKIKDLCRKHKLPEPTKSELKENNECIKLTLTSQLKKMLESIRLLLKR